MKTEHKYAQVLRWIADGEKVEGRYKDGRFGCFPCDFDNAYVGRMLEGDDGWEFRLKPRTITVNGREINAPIEHPENGSTVWGFDVLGNVFKTKFVNGESMSAAAAKFGVAFATEDDAKAARDEISKLLRSTY